MTKDKVSLYYCEAASNKEYHAGIEARDGGFVVNCAWGRRGSTLQTGTKTQTPVTYDKAKAIFDKLVKEKTSKGYSPGQAGTPYANTANEKRATGILPQLLNPIEECETERLIADDRYWMQQKFDGKRVLIRKTVDEVTGINRKGLSIALPEPISSSAQAIKQSCIIDGEACGDVLHAFDLLELGGVDLRKLGYCDRLKRLEDLLAPRSDAIRSIDTAKKKKEKCALFVRLLTSKQEGVVFKRHDASYVVGRPASGGSQLKFKFYASASCIVAGLNAKRSVSLELFDQKARLVNIGNVTIPVNHPVPAKGALVEVRYLYAFLKGALYQPTYLGTRDDIEPSACTVAQLKFKPDAFDDGDDVEA